MVFKIVRTILSNDGLKLSVITGGKNYLIYGFNLLIRYDFDPNIAINMQTPIIQHWKLLDTYTTTFMKDLVMITPLTGMLILQPTDKSYLFLAYLTWDTSGSVLTMKLLKTTSTIPT